MVVSPDHRNVATWDQASLGNCPVDAEGHKIVPANYCGRWVFCFKHLPCRSESTFFRNIRFDIEFRVEWNAGCPKGSFVSQSLVVAEH